MTNGLSDVFSTVSVPKPEYEDLVRDSEKLEIIKRKVKANKYVGMEELKEILDIENETETIGKGKGE